MKRVALISLGCAKNLVDSEVMLGLLHRSGFQLTCEVDGADVVIVNTCGFIEDAKRESIEAILEMAQLKTNGDIERLIVTGCLSQRYPSALAEELPEVDAFLGVDQIREIVAAVQGERPAPIERPGLFLYNAHDPRVLTTPRHWAYVKISEGCDHTCSFCVIPQLRGAHRSRKIDDILLEVEGLAASGVKEINLIAQDTTQYGRDFEMKDGLARLISNIADIPQVAWIRPLYLYPHHLSPALLEIMGQCDKVAKYLDVPLQHVNRRVLAAMRRGSDRKGLARFLDQVRREVPGVFLRTSLIVGFPTEDEEAFAELAEFVVEQEFDHLGVFAYSHEEESLAEVLGDPHDAETKARRKDVILNLQRDISARKLTRLLGRTVTVLVEGPHPDTDALWRGRHQGQAPEVDGEVLITQGRMSPGDMIPVTVEETFDYDIAGRVIGGVEP